MRLKSIFFVTIQKIIIQCINFQKNKILVIVCRQKQKEEEVAIISTTTTTIMSAIPIRAFRIICTNNFVMELSSCEEMNLAIIPTGSKIKEVECSEREFNILMSHPKRQELFDNMILSSDPKIFVSNKHLTSSDKQQYDFVEVNFNVAPRICFCFLSLQDIPEEQYQNIKNIWVSDNKAAPMPLKLIKNVNITEESKQQHHWFITFYDHDDCARLRKLPKSLFEKPNPLKMYKITSQKIDGETLPKDLFLS